MKQKSKKELLTILFLTVIFGIGTFFLAKYLDKEISEVIQTRYKIEELTRYATDKETRISEYESVADYTEVLEQSLPESDDIIEIIQQLEILGDITGINVSIKLEEGIIGEEGIEFENEEERVDFMKNLEVKEYETPDSTSQDTSTGEQPANWVLQMMEEAEEEEEEQFKINYLEIDLSLKGTYAQIRTYISMMRNSKYLFNIKEVRLVKDEEGGRITGTLLVRAFIFEK